MANNSSPRLFSTTKFIFYFLTTYSSGNGTFMWKQWMFYKHFKFSNKESLSFIRGRIQIAQVVKFNILNYINSRNSDFKHLNLAGNFETILFRRDCSQS